ncbi:MAG TPA: xanthine dehydrogenase family protein molybdopterin-binding subunit [Anaerolineales bacterium]|nr:xanthine dehydrogenase family protein molybdopterin-binding subunit [Anaerolineales bacterium]HNS59520.1 xanthine dehydrogenase family protein molybdopterin-binding subunit [Anaerolineales bacterium]
MTDTPLIGQRVPKLDAPNKATGKTTYGHDVRLPGMLHGRILYSRYPHAKIIRLDTSRAEKLRGVKCVLTPKDNPPHLFGYGKDNKPFKDVARSSRDEIAGVVATDPDIAEEALSLIEADYELLPNIFSPREALAEGALLIHPEHGSNLFQRYNYSHGDLAQGESDSAVVVEEKFLLPYVSHVCMETSVVVAQFDHRGHLTLWSTTQIPFLLQRDLSEALGISGSNVRIIQTAVGGAFGRGLDIYPYEPIAALMSRKTGQPVRVAFSREEEFLAGPARQPAEVIARAGANADGTLTFRDVSCMLDVGAYISWGTVTPLVMMETTASLYQVPHARFTADCVYTNNLITGAMRGYGNPQSTFFIETLMDRLAEALNMDPVDFRIMNANVPNSTTPQGLVITSCGLKECLEAVAASADRSVAQEAPSSSSKKSSMMEQGNNGNLPPYLKRGIGFASTLNVGGGARIYRSDGCGATVKVDDFGHVTLVTGSTEIGQGSETVLAQIVAQTLGVRIENVTVLNSDTDIKPWDVGVHASRTTFIAGNAAYLAAVDARNQIFETASQLLGVDADQLSAREGQVAVKNEAGKSISLEQVARRRHFREGGKVILGEGWYDPPTQLVDKDTYKGNISAAYGFGAQMAEVEVDTETGKVRVLRLACANDVGHAINPMAVEGQIEGGAQMGLGYALTEELIVKDGKVLNPDLLDYRLFTSADMPIIETHIIETDDPGGPFGAKGVGEMGGTPTAAAIANAIYDAVGVRMNQVPMTPERVLAALDAKA